VRDFKDRKLTSAFWSSSHKLSQSDIREENAIALVALFPCILVPQMRLSGGRQERAR
jgi:hypothetical protein